MSQNPEGAVGSSPVEPPRQPRPAEEAVGELQKEPRSFEEAFGELQRVVEQLEDGGLDLERAVHLFDRGTRLAQICERIVDDAELRVTRLSAEPASPLSDAPAET